MVTKMVTMQTYMQHLCILLVNPLSRVIQKSKCSFQIVLVVFHLKSTSMMHRYIYDYNCLMFFLNFYFVLMMFACLEMYVSKCIVIAEPVTSSSMTIHLWKKTSDFQSQNPNIPKSSKYPSFSSQC